LILGLHCDEGMGFDSYILVMHYGVSLMSA
jgi:hypothetical protein